MKASLPIFLIAAMLFPASCTQNKVPTETITESAETTEHTSDTLIIKSEAVIDSVPFIILKSNPLTTKVEMVDSIIPDINDSGIALCVEAAFTGELLKEFKTTNVAGDYIVNGKFRKGYRCKANTGFLATVNGQPFISSSAHVDEWIGKELESGGNLFQQVLLIENSKAVYTGKPIKLTSTNIYRAACILNDGRFAVIQSLQPLQLGKFITSLIQLSVSDALYLDMGTGWNYGWYRVTPESVPKKLFNNRSPHQTNWIVVKYNK